MLLEALEWASKIKKITKEEINIILLAGYIWELKDSNIPYTISWDTLGRAPSYNPDTKTCRLCTLEKFFILYHPRKASLNQRTEIF